MLSGRDGVMMNAFMGVERTEPSTGIAAQFACESAQEKPQKRGLLGSGKWAKSAPHMHVGWPAGPRRFCDLSYRLDEVKPVKPSGVISIR